MKTKKQAINEVELARKWNYYRARPSRLIADIAELLPRTLTPEVTDFAPLAGLPGCRMTIEGSRFSPQRDENKVTVGGEQALVLEASADTLDVVTGLKTGDGPVEVTVDGETGKGPVDFTLLPWPSTGSGEDGPPLFFEGAGMGRPVMGLDPLGTSDVLVVVCHAQDRVPANLANTRTDVMTTFDNVDTYFDQISYGRKRINLDYSNWVPLSGNYTDYVDASINNIDNPDGLNRIVAEAAQGAIDDGFDLDDYDLMTVCLFLDTDRIRAWGGWNLQNISYNGNGLNINITVDHALELIAIGHNANWGRFAHEIGHNLVSGGAVLPEDVYSSDLIHGDNATAEAFDLMGDHDLRPAFSGFYMDQLGYFTPGNIIELTWDRNPFEATYDIQEHGDTENSDPNRCHLVKIRVGAGVFYYIETRRRNGAPRVFDHNIPTGGATHNGGVIITKVFSDQVNINQEVRLITLLHDVHTLDIGADVDDPERGLEIRVESVVDTTSLTLRVRVAWAQEIVDVPGGTFDLSLTQAERSWISDDIWVDRQPCGLTAETDDQGRTVATIEKPVPGEVNRLYAQVHNSGPDDASNVKMTFYAITPPGVGDNGAWAPIATNTILSVPGNGTPAETWVPWTPLVGDHTCLKVHAEHQFGEILGGNNSAQENVFYFSPPAGSPPVPVKMMIALRNPRDEKTIIRADILHVPEGYVVHLPHSWAWVDGKGEKLLELTIVPFKDIGYYLEMRKQLQCALEVAGRIPRCYGEEVAASGVPAHTHWGIGGITVSVNPKLKGSIEIDKEKDLPVEIAIRGAVQPPRSGQQVRVCIKPASGGARYGLTMTGAQGRFSYRHSPGTVDQKARKPWNGARTSGATAEGKDVYVVQAEIFHAADLADAKSNRLYFDTRKSKPKTDTLLPSGSKTPGKQPGKKRPVKKMLQVKKDTSTDSGTQ